MELHEALSHIAEIRSRIAATERFRGYRAAPIAFSGVCAIVVACFQSRLVPEPLADIPGYLSLWITTAVLGFTAAGWGIWARHRHGEDRLCRQLTFLAVGQFVPCLVAGALITAMIVRHAPEHVPVLPGIWQVLFSLGVFASYRLLPRPIVLVGLFYLCSGAYQLRLVGSAESL